MENVGPSDRSFHKPPVDGVVFALSRLVAKLLYGEQPIKIGGWQPSFLPAPLARSAARLTRSCRPQGMRFGPSIWHSVTIFVRRVMAARMKAEG